MDTSPFFFFSLKKNVFKV